MQQLTSLGEDGMHRPVLDVVVPLRLVVGADGHTSIYIDRQLRWGQYLMLLAALAAAGIIDQTFVKASQERGYSFIPDIEEAPAT